MTSILHVYIPRILGHISKNIIVNTFEKMNIGDIFYVDMHRKVNENKNVYYFAFISLRLYDTSDAISVYNSLETSGITRIYYDENNEKNYWELKKHVICSNRSRIPSPRFYLHERKTKSYEIFTKKDENDLFNDYCDLEREIFTLCCGY